MQREVHLTDAPRIRKWEIAIAMAMADVLPWLGFGEQRKEDSRAPRETHAHGHASWHGMGMMGWYGWVWGCQLGFWHAESSCGLSQP